MQNVLDLMHDIINNGVQVADRTGYGTRSLKGRMLRWNLQDGFPIITTRKVAFRIAFEEMMFFLRGETDTKLLEEKKINIWKGNTTREFLDGRGLTYLPEGDMGKGYGRQMRMWESPRVPDPIMNHAVKYTDQIRNLIDGLQNDPFSRRHVVTHWNPGQLDEMALPPCHLMHMYGVEGEFHTEGGKLHSCFIMRSTDVYHGLPYNIMGYAFLNAALAKLLGLESGDLVYFGWDVHLYNHQLEVATQQLAHKPFTLPKLKINKELNTIHDIMNLEFTDLELVGYNTYPALEKVEMAV